MNRISGVDTRINAPLSRFTTFQLGGPCKSLSFCKQEDDALQVIHQYSDSEWPLLWMGSGSNLLVSDTGVDAHMLRYQTEAIDMEVTGDQALISTACKLDSVVKGLAEQGKAGLNYCSGIPGTVGGALVGNAGAWGKQLGDRILWVNGIDRKGVHHRFRHDECEFSYRHSVFKTLPVLVTRIALSVEPADARDLLREREDILETRKAKHPDWTVEPCIGSIFRNVDPTSKAGRRRSAGWFLEQAGMKRATVGGAEIYAKHANIIIAKPHAISENVVKLIDSMAAAVHNHHGVSLIREVRYLGDFKDHPGPRPADFH